MGLLIGLPLLFLLILAVFPWGLLGSAVCRAATERFGRPVTIGSVHRVDSIGFHPTIAVEDLKIPQAGWAGQGDFARVAKAEIRFSVWPLLRGAFVPEDIRVSGLRLALVRDQQGRTNWSRPGEPEQGGSATDLQGLTVTDGVVSYRDARRIARPS